jgi:drug/metabolite transporter (DMT)-like permease
MEWYVVALLAPAFWAMNNVFIKFLITKKFHSYFATIFTVVLMDAIFALAVFVLVPVRVSFPYSVIGLLVGLMPLAGFWFYSKALLTEEVTRIITLFQLIPVFVVLLSVIFLDEVLGVQKYLGISLIVVASMLISYRKSGGKPFSSALKFMVPFGVIIASYTISDKILLGYLDYSSLFFWNIMGTFCGALLLFSIPRLRRETVKAVIGAGKKAVITTFVGEGLYVAGTLCSLVALSLVNASLASSLFGLQPFFVFFYTLFLSIFLPRILKEEINRSIVSLKISAIALMLIGTWLVI